MGDNHQVALLLTYPYMSTYLILHVDAPKNGFGCALYQKQQDQLRVIGYGNRTLVATEKLYHSFKLEYLVLKWAVCDYFKPYFYFVKHSDVFNVNNLLLYTMSTGKLKPNGLHWESK